MGNSPAAQGVAATTGAALLFLCQANPRPTPRAQHTHSPSQLVEEFLVVQAVLA